MLNQLNIACAKYFFNLTDADLQAFYAEKKMEIKKLEDSFEFFTCHNCLQRFERIWKIPIMNKKKSFCTDQCLQTYLNNHPEDRPVRKEKKERKRPKLLQSNKTYTQTTITGDVVGSFHQWCARGPCRGKIVKKGGFCNKCGFNAQFIHKSELNQ